MIEGIKMHYSTCSLKKEASINQTINVEKVRQIENNIDKVHVELQSKKYFYQDEVFVTCDEKKKEKLFAFPLSNEQVGYFMKQGHEVEGLECNELDKNKMNTARRQSEAGQGGKIDRLKQHTDGMYIYAINNQGALSINDLYKGSYSFQGNKDKYTVDQVNSVLKLNNLDLTKGNQWAVDKLLSLGLEVSSNNIIKLQNVKAAVDALPVEEAEEEQIQTNPDRILIEEEKILYIEKDIKDIIDDLTQVDEEIIEETLSEGKQITIGNLREVLHKNTEKALGKEVKPTKGDREQTKEVKEQLNEIRGKLNTEAAIKISEKMPLESTELAKVVKELRTVEEESIEEALKQADIMPTEETKEIMRETLQAAHRIYRQRDITVGIEMSEDHTVEKIVKALSVYEENALKPERRFGESIGKVEEQIAEVLEEQGIQSSKERQSAAKALITNGIELTKENVEKASKVMQKIDVFLEEMTPGRVATLIKEGINPYKASISQIVEWMGEKQLPKLKNIVAEAIVSLEERGQINESQKQGLLGLYRIIGGVVKNKEQVVGYILKNQLPLTIEKLEEATKYVKQTEHIKVTIDDEFGVIEELKYTRETAKQMIDHSHEEMRQLIDIEYKELFSNANKPNELLKMSSMIYPLIKSEIKKELGKFENEAVLSSSMIEKLNAVKTVLPEVLETMNKHQIPITLSNLYWMQKLVENPNLYGELLQKVEMNKEAFPKSIEEMEEDLKQFGESAKEKREIASDKGDIAGYRQFKQLEEVSQLQKQMINKEGLYQIPFMIDGEPKMVHLYVQDKEKVDKQETEGALAVITYETKGLGTIVAKVQIEQDKLKVNIQGESQESTGRLRRQSKQLEMMIEKIGYSITASEYSVEKSDNVILNPKQAVRRGESDFEAVV